MMQFIPADAQKAILIELDPVSMCALVTGAYEPTAADAIRRGPASVPRTRSVSSLPPLRRKSALRWSETCNLTLKVVKLQPVLCSAPRERILVPLKNILAMTKMTAVDGGAAIKAAVLRQPGW